MEDAIVVNNVTLTYKTTTRRQNIRSLSFFSLGEKCKRLTALDHVSFSVKKGEILGILGTNGSGKSTLLRTVAGVLAPDSGTVETFGRSVSLLSLGVGFNTDLSGMDNIYLSGMLLGFSEAEIHEKCQQIVEFSELGDAIYRPVKTYSSGMHSKLAFSIAVTLRTDLILVDEVLSVGDIRFRKKSYQKMEELIRDSNTTVIIVSHNMNEIQKLCDRVLWLEKGKVRSIGPTESMIKEYLRDLQTESDKIVGLAAPELTVKVEANGVRISWDPVAHANDYLVYRKETVPGARWQVIQPDYWDTVYLDYPPAETGEYVYAVRARMMTKNGLVRSEFIPSEPVRVKAAP